MWAWCLVEDHSVSTHDSATTYGYGLAPVGVTRRNSCLSPAGYIPPATKSRSGMLRSCLLAESRVDEHGEPEQLHARFIGYSVGVGDSTRRRCTMGASSSRMLISVARSASEILLISSGDL